MPKQTVRRQLEPVPLNNVRIEGGFWGQRTRVNREVTLPLERAQLKQTGRLDAFKLKWKPGRPHKPHQFWDSDVAKWIEAAAYSLATHPDRKLERELDAVIDDIAGAQRDDGYVNTYFTLVAPDKRWTNLRDMHELYCAGHLMEAAVAFAEATGKRKLLDVMARYADYIDSVFGRGRGKRRGYPGHEEIELALVRLARATGNLRYRGLAAYFVDERGRQPHYYDREARERGEDRAVHGVNAPYDILQAHLPVREQTTAEGHSVRALYLFSGMADVAAETGDPELLAACRRLWRNIAQRRMYITGAVGSTRHGERFTFDYDLPNETAYAETCANIALVFFAHRMLQLEARGEYADVMERALYNGVISGVSLDGKAFFYDNLLASNPPAWKFNGQKPPVRQEWFGCACCPPNIARLLASLGGYVYATGRGSVWLHLYANGSVQCEVAGRRVELGVETAYPWEETVRIRVRPEQSGSFGLALRLPGWCREPRVAVNGEAIAIRGVKGYAVLKRTWQDGDVVELTLPMPPERVSARPEVREDAGRVALQRGPVVYCLEQADNGAGLNAIVLPRDAELRAKLDPKLLGGCVTLEADALREAAPAAQSPLYGFEPPRAKPCRIKAIPYALWANRGEGEMLVWVREGGKR